MNDFNSLMTLADVAEFLQLSEKTVLKMVKNREIPCTKIANQWRFSRPMLNDWITSRMEVIPQNDLSRLLRKDFEIVPLSRLIYRKNILPIRSTDRFEALKEMAQNAFESNLVSDKKDFLEKLIKREEMSSTAICSGIAIPHMREPSEDVVREARILIGYSREGIDFKSTDDHPTHILFLLITDSEVVHLKVLSRLSALLKDPENVETLCGFSEPEEFLRFFVHYDQEMLRKEINS